MGAGWNSWLMLVLIVGAFTGCLNSQKNLKPPTIPDEYVLPPSGDSRFTAYPTYPARVMGESRIKQEQQAQIDQTPGAPGAGGH
jgi:hypothetical protein